MRIPRDIPLAVYIKRLIKADKIQLFYYSEDWKELREDVLDFFHHECQECLKRGDYTKADCVHHVNHVTSHPEMALSKWYYDFETGETKSNLVPLCNACHNQAHPEKAQIGKAKEKFTNEEKW